MLQTTKGIVLRSVKYGDTSLITTVFTEVYGLQSYIIKGVRSPKKKQGLSGLLQAASLLELVADHRPQHNLHYIREFQPAYLYTSLHEDITKNSVAIFSVELLNRLLPAHEPVPDLFTFAYDYFIALDSIAATHTRNFPLYFTIQCSKHSGYTVSGSYSENTPYLNSREGTFTAQPPSANNILLQQEDVQAFIQLMSVNSPGETGKVPMTTAMRNRLLDWYIEFLQLHTQHLGILKSPDILRMILH